MAEYYDEDELEPVEGYCLRCRETIEVEDAEPVWTRKGHPATRGTCPMCGGVVFRMGRTDAHQGPRPEAVTVGDANGRTARPKLAQDTVYVNFAPDDTALAHQLAADLTNAGFSVWLHDHAEADVNWSTGVHPALQQCARMVVLLSPAALTATDTVMGWRYFREQRKPIAIAQVAAVDVPDALRRSPRYDLTSDYKRNFRQLIGVLS